MKLSLFFKNCGTCIGEPIPLQVAQGFFKHNAIIPIFLVNTVDMLGSSRHKGGNGIIMVSIPIQMSHTNPLCLRPLVLEITRYNTVRNSNIELGVPVVPLPCLMEVNNLKT